MKDFDNEKHEALKTIESMLFRCEKMIPKFNEGTSQHTLLINRIRALKIIKILLNEEIPSQYSDEEICDALEPIKSIIRKTQKAQSKYLEGTTQYKRYINTIKSMKLAESLLENYINNKTIFFNGR